MAVTRVFPLPKGSYTPNMGSGRYGAPRPTGPHSGQDYSAAAGTTIYACQAGTVIVASATKHEIWGYYVEIRHEGGARSLYAHMVRPPRVKVGDRVSAGTPIGAVGNTGYSFGNHLHLTVYGQGGGTVDPISWLAGVPHVGSGVPVAGVKPGDGTGGRPAAPPPGPQDERPGSGLSFAPFTYGGRFALAGGGLQASTAELVESVTLDAGSDQVAQLSLVSHDPSLALASSELAALDATLVWELGVIRSEWDIAAVEVRGSSSQVRVDARSRLARNLRRRYRLESAAKVSPSEWVTRHVRGAGGVAVVQRSARRAEISQGSDQSELEVIGSLADELGWSWVEYGGRLLFGSKWWAWSGGTGLPHWKVSWRSDPGTDALDVTLGLTTDAKDVEAAGSVVVPWTLGVRVWPWHTVQLEGLGRWDGTYLVDRVSAQSDGTSPVELELIVPRKPVVSRDRGVSGDTQTRLETPPTRDKKSPAYAKWYARQLMRRAPYKWTSDEQWRALEQLWTRESGWRWNADNPTSDAYGIPQALPGSKMSSAGADWRTNPETQIKWGLDYIRGRYGGPKSAWAFWQANNWY